MREQLLATVEQLVTAIECGSGLPEYVHGESCGVRTRTPRRDHFCKGYTYRQMSTERELVVMISTMLFNLTLFTASIKRDWQLHTMPDTALLAQAASLAREYYAANPVSE